MASSIPKQHLTACLFNKKTSKILIRSEYEFFTFTETAYYPLRISRSAYNIRHCLHLSAAIDIGNNLMIRIFIQKFRKLLCRARVCQRTAGTHVRNEHPFFRIKYFCRLSHEMHSCKDYGFRICLFRILRQCKAVSETIRNFLYLRQSVIMR